ncbi:hypothetical protein [Methyloversatilis sp.]|uniref:gp53-like domain-containing protein n=1 Tax=Methyloversatilis sp. TaxID=2569862 RepID=UPI0027324FF6|nr:hypothetical protein [Methyloversatilis sp.]MDP3579136.1 hypothetical protein [Methyloversatilis sp.]
MANLTEVEEYTEGIYQFEETDPVQGGPGGIDNLPTKQLANRTKWLKASYDALADAFSAIDFGLFAPKDSPALTGNPLAPTPTQFDSDTSIATTAFVQRALGNRAGLIGIETTPYNLLPADAGKFFYGSSAASVVNLPSVSSVPAGATYTIQTAVPIVVQRTGSDTIFANGGGQTSITLPANTTATFTKGPNVNSWAVDGSARLPFDGNFVSALGSSGYQRLPSGLIIQWGGTTAGTSGTITFPIAWPNSMMAIAAANQITVGTPTDSVVFRAATTSQIPWVRSSATAFLWIALGF